MAETHLNKTLPTIDAFKKLSDTDRRRAYMAGYKNLNEGKAARPEARIDLLKRYASIASWSEEEILALNSAAVTPIRQSAE